jgi:hypothetical protein
MLVRTDPINIAMVIPEVINSFVQNTSTLVFSSYFLLKLDTCISSTITRDKILWCGKATVSLGIWFDNILHMADSDLFVGLQQGNTWPGLNPSQLTATELEPSSSSSSAPRRGATTLRWRHVSLGESWEGWGYDGTKKRDRWDRWDRTW